MLELQRHFGLLLRDAAIFEGIGELLLSPIPIRNCDCVRSFSARIRLARRLRLSAVKLTWAVRSCSPGA